MRNQWRKLGGGGKMKAQYKEALYVTTTTAMKWQVLIETS
jgi:hypothetical protein